MKLRYLFPVFLALAAAATTATDTRADIEDGRVGPALGITGNGRVLTPAGRMTVLGNFPSGGAMSPDGRFYWAIDSGLGRNDVMVVSVQTGEVTQTLPLPGGYGAVAFAPDGRRAYVSGQPKGDVPATGPTKGDAGDVIHVFDIDAAGHATEAEPIALPAPESGLDWPIGLAVTPDGKRLVVALNQQSSVAIVDLASGAARTVATEAWPNGIALSPDGKLAFVTCEYAGAVDVVDLDSARVTKKIGVGGEAGDAGAHATGIVMDPKRPRAYVAVSSRDDVAVIDTEALTVERTVSVARSEAVGAQPVALAVAPNGRTLYVADSGEDAVAAISLVARRARTKARRKRARRRDIAGLKAFKLIGRIPTAAYPTGVAVTPDGGQLIWLAAKGLGSGPNRDYVQYSFNAAPYGSYVPETLVGRLGVLRTPTDHGARRLTAAHDAQVVPNRGIPLPPPGSPVVGPDGGPSDKIKHVFYVVRENRTYDQIFGTDPRGDGDPRLQLFDDNGVEGPTGGVTPNAHRLSKLFPLIDHFYANSEVSIDGHNITAGGWAIDMLTRELHANYGNRGKTGNSDNVVDLAPNGSIFDEAARRGVTFRNYGETSAGSGPSGDDGRPTYQTVRDNTDPLYTQVDTDAGVAGTAGAASGATPGGHIDLFRAQFELQLAQGNVPSLNYILLGIDHTLGTTPGIPTPSALVADNDLALGQFVDIISHSPIWEQSAIFVVEDDSQDGADHVDAHRMPAFVISPWAKRGAVVHTRYDQVSVLRTIGLILGLQPLSLTDGLATPMFDAFDTTADVEGTRYTAVAPEQNIKEPNLPSAPDAELSRAMPFDELDLVPQAISDRILWHSVWGQDSKPPAPGPNASVLEHGRALGALRILRRGGDVREWLEEHGGEDDD